jgi:carbamoyl-phosphate synthase large subunit
MDTAFSILITSISHKIPLIHAVRTAAESLGVTGKICGADCDGDCLGKHFVDDMWVSPPQEELTVEMVIEYCKAHNVKAIIPTRDGELPFFANNCEALAEEGIHVMISQPQVIDLCRDKLLFSQYLADNDIPAIPASLSLDDIKDNNYVVKERFGAGSVALGLNLNRFQAKAWAKQLEDPVFQPFVPGSEYSIDIYVDKSGVTHGCVVRSRDKVVNGESQVTTSVEHPPLEELCVQVGELLQIYGHAVFQAICEPSGDVALVECNARFGGASTLSIACGLHSFEWFILEILGKPLPPMQERDCQFRQVRFPADIITPV